MRKLLVIDNNNNRGKSKHLAQLKKILVNHEINSR